MHASPRSDCGVPKCHVVTATLQVVDASGNPQPQARLGARFMDAYGLDGAVGGR